MKIIVHLQSRSQGIEYTNVKNAYTKDGMYCIYQLNDIVHKYPLVNIFRIDETYK